MGNKTKNDISLPEKEETLKKILSSQEFRKSESNKNLLEYLFETSLKGAQINEYTIALDYFQKGKTFNPSDDPSIRVYISKLRKKIDYFYKTAGINEEIRLQIPKGHYDITFERIDVIKAKNYKPQIKFLMFTSIFLFLILLFYFVKIIPNYSDEKNKYISSPIWSDFFRNGKPTIIVLGDYFFLYEYLDEMKQRLFIRNPKINSKNELATFLKNNPQQQGTLNPLEFTYLRPSGSFALFKVLPIFWGTNITPTPKLASELVWSDIENSNVIFIGSIKSMGILNKLLKKIKLEYLSNPNEEKHSSLVLYNNNGEVINEFIPTSRNLEESYKDYGIISKIKGAKNNSILLLIGFDELAIMKAVNTISDFNFITILKKDVIKDEIPNDFFFKLIFETEGFR